VDHPDVIAGRIDVDHIEPVVALEDSGGAKDWNVVVARMFCEESNIQAICIFCHKLKTASERSERARYIKINKK
jgi:hypothetical protein